MQVRDVLKSKGTRVISIGPEATVSDAVARLVQNNIGSLPVVDGEGRLLGVFSERDVLRVLHTRGEGLSRVKMQEVMTRDPITCTLDDDVNEVMGKMSERRIAKVPVLNGEMLAGIVSVGDVIKVMYERVQNENSHLMTYLYGSAPA